MKSRRIVFAGVGVVLLAGVAGWFRPLPPAATTASARQAPWRLPAPANLERSTAAQFAATSGVAWLGDDGGGDAGPGTQWTLLGVVGRPGDRAVLVQSGSDPLIKRLRSGDTLPDGSKLVSVGSSGIVVDRDGCRTERPLYPGGTASSSDEAAGEACPPPGTD